MRIKNRYNIILTAFICVVLCAVLAGCDNSENEEVSYTVISGGTMSETELATSQTEDAYANVSDTQLYIPDKMVTKYASLTFDERMQDAYNDVVDTMVQFNEKSYIPLTISTEDYVRVLETVRCEQMMLFYLQNRYAGEYVSSKQTFEMNFIYKCSIRDVNIMLMKSEKAAKEIVSQTGGMSDYEKLKFFHDYLVLNVESSTDAPNGDSIYGALVEKQALCEGFAKAFSYLCNLSGIENIIVTGYTDVDHMWNMVKLNDNWYHIDVGWDKPSAVLAEQYPNMILYQYFLAQDSVLENNRVISDLLAQPPNAESSDDSYFTVENKYAADYQQVLEIIEESCRKCIDADEDYFMIKLDSSNLYLQTTTDLIKPDENGVSDIDRIVESLNFKGRISYIDYYKANRIIIFVLE